MAKSGEIRTWASESPRVDLGNISGRERTGGENEPGLFIVSHTGHTHPAPCTFDQGTTISQGVTA